MALGARSSPHLLVGVKLFVCLVSEPGTKRGREVRAGQDSRITPKQQEHPKDTSLPSPPDLIASVFLCDFGEDGHVKWHRQASSHRIRAGAFCGAGMEQEG